MTGFFSKKETQSNDRPEGKLLTCYSCGLYKDCITPKMQPYGNFDKRIINIGEAPGTVDDQEGKPWQGKTGRLLQRTYERLGVDLFEDCVNINAVSCRPMENGKNRLPSNVEIECCRKSVLSLIKLYKPKLVVLLGNAAIYSVLGTRWKGSLNGVNEWRGFAIPDLEFNTWICPVFHPSFVERSLEDQPVTQIVWGQDLQNAFYKLNEKLSVYNKPEITFLEDISMLDSLIKTGQTISFDYETTGIKPHAKGHKIVCCSVAVNEDEVYVFEMPGKIELCKQFINILKDKNIRKMAHNCKFEENWSYEILGTRVRGWLWDSMLAAHILDNRAGITGLKFQTFVNFGIQDYSISVKSYLESENSNGINKVEKLMQTSKGKRELMEYCALDSIYQYRLAMKQMKEFEIRNLPF